MKREDQLKFCKKCLNRKLDLQQGLICNLTQKRADFEGECKDFIIDESVAVSEQTEKAEERIPENLSFQIENNSKRLLLSHQDFNYAVIGGLASVLISAIIWAVITVVTQYQIGFMAIGVGFVVGYAVQFFGAGIDQKFGILGAVLSLFGCILGNLFSQVGFIANEHALGYFETLTYLNFGLIVEIFTESFSPMDLVFYGIAIYEGYKFSFRRITDEILIKLKTGEYDGLPKNYNLRMPLAIISFISIFIFVFLLRQGVSGYKTYYYESGNIMSEGELKHNTEIGEWTYYYESGTRQSVGFYKNGLPDSLWTWYDETGAVARIGMYRNGIEDGIWKSYYQNGQLSDSGLYVSGRMQGEWKYWYEGGTLYQIGSFHMNQQNGTWITYYENGQLWSKGEMYMGSPKGDWIDYYENGQVNSTTIVDEEGILKIVDSYNKDGTQQVKNGSGVYKLYTEDRQLIESGNIENGLRSGSWSTYYDNGNKKEALAYVNGTAQIISFWNLDGEQTVFNGQGTVLYYYPDSESIYESGEVEDGRREGIWNTYYPETNAVYQTINYENGELNGKYIIYYESGSVYTAGFMKDGLKDGKWEWYFENGILSSEVNFVDDLKHGEQRIWSETGELLIIEYYEQGVFQREEIMM